MHAWRDKVNQKQRPKTQTFLSAARHPRQTTPCLACWPAGSGGGAPMRLRLLLAASAGAQIQQTCWSDLQPPNGNDALVMECKPWCSEDKQAEHCPRCRCRGCSFCGGWDPPSPPLLPPLLPPPVSCSSDIEGDSTFEACFSWCRALPLGARIQAGGGVAPSSCGSHVWARVSAQPMTLRTATAVSAGRAANVASPGLRHSRHRHQGCQGRRRHLRHHCFRRRHHPRSARRSRLQTSTTRTAFREPRPCALLLPTRASASRKPDRPGTPAHRQVVRQRRGGQLPALQMPGMSDLHDAGCTAIAAFAAAAPAASSTSAVATAC